MNTVIRATDSAEFLGLIPSIAGFTPQRSLVLMPFAGNRTYGAMRVDLPEAGTDPGLLAAGMCSLATQVDGVDALALVIYCDDDARVSDAAPRRELAEAVIQAIDDQGLRLVDALYVGTDGWGSYLNDRGLRPLSSIPSPPPIPGIGDVSGDQLSGVALPSSSRREQKRVGRLFDELRATTQASAQPSDSGVTDVVDRVLANLPAFFESILERPDDLDAEECAALLWCLDRPTVRDAALVQWATNEEGGAFALDAQLAFAEHGTPIPDEIGSVFLGEAPRPDADRLGCALNAVRHVASRAPRHARPGALTAAGWLSWALGRSSHAGTYLNQALEIDPKHSMASLLSTMVGAAILPPWLMERP